MKQRIRVSAICKKDGDILLLKRAGGRLDGVGVDFELPTGKIIFGEQPEEAMARVLYEHTGVKTASLQLMDVVTFTSLEGTSQLGSLYIIYEDIELSARWSDNDGAPDYFDEGRRGPFEVA